MNELFQDSWDERRFIVCPNDAINGRLFQNWKICRKEVNSGYGFVIEFVCVSNLHLYKNEEWGRIKVQVQPSVQQMLWY